MIKVGFYQLRPSFGKKRENLKKTIKKIENVEADLIVLPEFFATGYQFISKDEVADLSEEVPYGETTLLLSEVSMRKDIFIVAGIPEKEGDKFYNSAILTGPKGFIGVYRKTHLFFEEKIFFSPGNTGFKVWETDIGRIGIMIWFDWFFPESMRTLALLGAEIVAHPSNLVLPYCPHAMPFRCLENRIFAITANRVGAENRKNGKSYDFIGMSQIVSPQGDIIVRASKKREEFLVAEIDLKLATDKSINQYNDLFKDRRPEYYII
ncbi:MAG: hypothetical protein N2511_06380 [Thermodesulfovibrionales bacterium]|nr:hypothetical protein [Thermodesulfovibrionales bacterium]